jgi:hypothetical protein
MSTTAEWENFLSGMGIFDGIDPSQGSAMAPSLDTPGRNAVIAAGNALIKGQLWRCDASVSTAIPAASAQDRIDRLVIRLTRTASTSPTVIQPVIITGTPSGSPVEPPLVQTTTGIFDIPVARWTSTAAGAITSLVDERQFSRQQLLAYKAASLGRASLTSLTNDPDLQVIVSANAVYIVEAFLSYNTLAASGIGFAFGWFAPSGFGGRVGVTYRMSGDTATVGGGGPASTVDLLWNEHCDNGGPWGAGATPGDNKNHSVMVNGLLTLGANGGPFGLRWCQDASNVTALTLNLGSWLSLTRVSLWCILILALIRLGS